MAETTRAEQPKGDDTEGTARSISSEELLSGSRQLIIRHGSERYRLLLTKSNKLILTK